MTPERAAELFDDLRIPEVGYVLRIGHYPGGRTAVVIEDDFGTPEGKLTVNLPEEPLDPGEFFVKLNDPLALRIVHELARFGLVRSTSRVASAGFVAYYAGVWCLVEDGS